MINVVLIDDERPALRELEFLLKDYPEISIAGMFKDALKAIEKMRELKPDIVFLDINMPGLGGIDAASLILDSSPNTDIIFVTAYDQYAIEAFEVHALDYILKPIAPIRLKNTIEHVIKKKPITLQNSQRKLHIKCLGRFYVAWENQVPIRWRAEKTKELFAFLFYNKNKDLSKEEILYDLWPEDDPNKAIRQLYNGIYYIRKALVEYGINKDLINIGSNYNLQIKAVDSDIERFFEFEKGNYTQSIEQLEELEALYIGDYLESEYYPWADFERERLLMLYLRCLLMLSKLYMEEKLWDKAESYLKKAYNKDPYNESATEILLKLYKETGNKSKAAKHFSTYEDLIKKELDINPSKKLYELLTPLT